MFDYDKRETGYGWCVVVCSFLLHAVVCGIAYSCAVINHVFRNYFNQPSHFMTSWIGTTLLAMTVLAGLPGTFLTYKVGYRVTVILGGVIAAAGMAISGFCTEYWQVLLSFSGMTGLGLGLSLTPSILVIEDYFFSRKTLALSCIIAGSGLGQIFIPVAIYHLEDMFAWKGMALILAGLCCNIVLCGAAYRPGPGRRVTHRERRALLKIFEPGLCRSTAFGAVCVSNFLWSFGSVIVYTYLPGYAIRNEQTPENAFILIGIAGLSATLSRPIFQLFGHSAKLDYMSVTMCSVGLCAILTGLHPEMMEHGAGQIGFAIMFGLHVGFWTTFVCLLSAELIGEEFLGCGRGFTTLCIGAGLIVGAPLSGWVLDKEDDYEIIFYLAGASMLLSSCIMAIANMKKCYFRPRADWCDSDSESSASGSAKQNNTCADEDILILQLERSEIFQEAISELPSVNIRPSYSVVSSVSTEGATYSTYPPQRRAKLCDPIEKDPVYRYSAFIDARESDV